MVIIYFLWDFESPFHSILFTQKKSSIHVSKINIYIFQSEIFLKNSKINLGNLILKGRVIKSFLLLYISERHS